MNKFIPINWQLTFLPFVNCLLCRKRAGVKIGEEKAHFSSCSLLRVGTVAAISGVCQTELAPKGGRLRKPVGGCLIISSWSLGTTLPGLEDLGGSHQAPPILDGIHFG